MCSEEKGKSQPNGKCHILHPWPVVINSSLPFCYLPLVWLTRIDSSSAFSFVYRLSPKYREDGQRASSHRSSHSPSSSCTGHSRSATPHQNGHKGSAQNGRHSHGALSEKKQEVWMLLFLSWFEPHLFLLSKTALSPPFTPPLLSFGHFAQNMMDAKGSVDSEWDSP